MATCTVPLELCCAVKQSNKVGHNGFVTTAIMMTDCPFLVVIVIALNANNAPPLIGFSVSNKNGYLFTTSW
jgi:hypothetical protein